MTHTVSPQGKEEKNNVPWRIAFTRKDLLAACWQSKKGADLLYHFLHRASWEAKNKHENETLKDIKFQESTPKALEKSRLSLGCFHTYLKLFVSVGYISTEAYSGEYTVHLDTIQAAFTNVPEKPGNDTQKRGYSRSESFNLKDCNFVTLSREDYEMLMELKDECFKLKEMFHFVTSASTELKEMFHSLKQNATIYAAQEASSDELSEPLEMLLEIDSNALREREKNGNSVDTPLPCAHPFLSLDLDPLCEDLAYSHNQPQPTMSQASLETRSTAVGAGYTNGQSSVKPPEKPNKGTKRTKKERVVQPALVDTSKKAVAYNEAEQQQFDWYCGCDFIHARPEQDANKKAHCGKLIAHVHSQEDMQSLADFTKARLSQQLQRDVYIAQLGNMANGDNLNAWIASRQKPQQTGKVIDFQQKTTQARPGSWRERFENDPNNGGYNDEASIEAFIKAGEEIANAAV